jgi:uncharacterized membrane protein YjjB (DUF3815 family)
MTGISPAEIAAWFKGPFFAAMATSAFSVLFGLRSADVLIASGGGALGWVIFQSMPSPTSVAFASFLAAFATGLYAEVAGRLRHRPATVYMIASIIPLVPGSGMYHMMLTSLQGDSAHSVQIGLETLMTAFALAAGLAVANALGRMLFPKLFRE